MSARRSWPAHALGALLVGGTLAVALPGAAAPAESADRYTRDCTYQIDGVPLRVQLLVQFAGERSDDVTRVSVRASDATERGTFRNPTAQITDVRIKVVGPRQKSTLDRIGTTSPFAVSLNPARDGRDAVSVTTDVRWNLTKKRTATVSCFYLDG